MFPLDNCVCFTVTLCCKGKYCVLEFISGVPLPYHHLHWWQTILSLFSCCILWDVRVCMLLLFLQSWPYLFFLPSSLSLNQSIRRHFLVAWLTSISCVCIFCRVSFLPEAVDEFYFSFFDQQVFELWPTVIFKKHCNSSASLSPFNFFYVSCLPKCDCHFRSHAHSLCLSQTTATSSTLNLSHPSISQLIYQHQLHHNHHQQQKERQLATDEDENINVN